MTKSILIYFLTFYISILFCFLLSKAKGKTNIIILFILSISLPIFISTFRYKVGTDYLAYRESYYEIIEKMVDFKSIISYYQEPLYVFINLMAYKIFNSYTGLLFIASLIFMTLSLKTIMLYKDKISLSLAYFIFFMTTFSLAFNGVRQMLAVSIIFYSYKYIYEKKLFKYILLILLASLFHKSAIVCLLLYFIWSDNGKNNKSFYVTTLATIIALPLIALVVRKICFSLGIYTKYFLHYEATQTYGFLLYILPVLIILILEKKDKNENNSMINFLSRLYILQIPMQILGNYIAYGDRLAMYLAPAQILLLPYYANSVKKNKLIINIIIVFWYLFYYVVMFIVLKSNEVYPFSFIWEWYFKKYIVSQRQRQESYE